MTIKEAILQSLEDIGRPTTYTEVYNHIIKHNYYNFKDNKTPPNTISAQLGRFIRRGDTRVKRIKQAGETYSYYLTKNEENIGIDILTGTTVSNYVITKPESSKSYDERDLHKLLSTFIKSTDNTFSKTIFHEQSNSKDNHQKWVHPDMVGVNFLRLQTEVSQSFLSSINRANSIKITSYEIKKEINSDYDLKKSFFQAVSNSSWANYGYLVAFEINSSLYDEMKRLNQSFGIGIIELDANAFESKILFVSKYKDLDFNTIDKLCHINPDFKQFIEQVDKLMKAPSNYKISTEKELHEFCDSYFSNETEIKKYCVDNNIPIEDSVELD